MGLDAFFSWDMVGTFAGAVALVVFLVQFLKLPLDKVKHVPTRFIVYGISVIVMMLAQFFTPEGITLEGIALILINAALVALAAMGTYEQLINQPETTKYKAGIEEGVLVDELVIEDNGAIRGVARSSDREGETDSEDEDAAK